jgi:hypothetical protein
MGSAGPFPDGSYEAWLWRRYQRRPPRFWELTLWLYPELERFDTPAEKKMALKAAQASQSRVWVLVLHLLNLLLSFALFTIFFRWMDGWFASIRPASAVQVATVFLLVLGCFLLLSWSVYSFGTRGGVRAALHRMSTASCPRCSYDLKGHPDADSGVERIRCPECGAVYTHEQLRLPFLLPSTPLKHLNELLLPVYDCLWRPYLGAGLLAFAAGALLIARQSPSLISLLLLVAAAIAGVFLLSPSRFWPFRYGALLLALGVTLRISTVVATREAAAGRPGWLRLDIPLIALGASLLLGGWLYRRRHAGEKDVAFPVHKSTGEHTG